MTITKYEHACLLLSEGNRQVVIDPGIYALSLPEVTKLDAVIVTHVHGDHFDPETVKKLLVANPSAKLYTTEQVAAQITSPQVVVPKLNKIYQAGLFELQFYGGQHARITADIPLDQNFGVRVGDQLYFPGDSLVGCPEPHRVLAIASMAPWLKLDEAVQLIKSDTAKMVLPVHDHFLSTDGVELTNRLLKGAAEQTNKVLRPLVPGQSL